MDQMRTARIIVSAGVLAVAVVAVVVAVIVDGDSAVVPVAIVLALGFFATLLVFWFRQRPIGPGDEATYVQTVVMKLAAAEVPALGSIVLAIVLGPGWVSLAGVAVLLALVRWVWPSPSDLERHHLLYLT